MRRHDAMGRPTFRQVKGWKQVKPTVEGVEKRILLATFTVQNLNDDLLPGSLRTAILASNATAGTNIIQFNIAAAGVQTIPIRTSLPVVTVPVLIDGTTERGYAGTPLVILSGAGAGLGVDGLDISAGNTTVQGLGLNSFTGEGINLSGAGNNTIQNNYIGINPAGTAAAGNALDGVLVQTGSNGNKILNNVISGNTANGVFVNGGPAATATSVASGTIISGNRIGTDAAGNGILPNGGDGVYLQNAPTTTIGGTTAAARNIIAGNRNGLELFSNSDNSVVAGNYIGTNAAGTVALGNSAGTGILLQGISNLTIGGTAAGARNLISGNQNGISSTFAGGTTIAIQGNYIGTNAAGTGAVGNRQSGIVLNGSTNVTIGGTAAAARNIIAGNAGDGINASFFTNTLVIQGNSIGTDVSGALALGNGGAGVNVASFGAVIGGIGAGAANIIANSGQSGVIVSGINDSILSNSIYNSQNLGIELRGGNNN